MLIEFYWLSNEYLFVVSSIKHWKSRCGKMQTPICHFYYLNIHLKCHKFADNFKTTGVFKISSYGNFVMTLFCALNLGKKSQLSQCFKALITWNKQWQTVRMPIRSCYTTSLPWRTVLFCKHVIFVRTIYWMASKLMSSHRTIFACYRDGHG